MTDQHDVHRILRRRLFGKAVECLADFLDRRFPCDVLVAFLCLIDEIDHVVRGNAQAASRLRELSTPLVEQLAVFRIACEADEDEKKCVQHYWRYPSNCLTDRSVVAVRRARPSSSLLSNILRSRAIRKALLRDDIPTRRRLGPPA